MHPGDPLTRHFRLQSAQETALRRLGIRTVRDLLYHFPSRFETTGAAGSAGQLVPGAKVALFGVLSKLKARKLWKSKRNIAEGWFEDASGKVKVMWFNQPYIASYVPQGIPVRISGTVGGSPEKPYIANPEVEATPEGTPAGENLFEKNAAPASAVFPVYPETRGVSSRWFFHALDRVFASDVLKELEDPIPGDVRARYNLPDLASALVWIHKPARPTHAEAARKRFSFEEIFALQTARAQDRARSDAEPSFRIEQGGALAEQFLERIEFPPTRAQRRAIADILGDLAKSHPMARLLEGDVGSGKTLVAAASAYAVVRSRPPGRASGTLQVAYMAPTEILAAQHFESFVQYFKHLPINIALMTGSGCKKFPSKVSPEKPTDISRAQLLKWVAAGEIAMLVGTHALIQKSVKFQHLAFAIVDEQHRFGTRQRRDLAQKSFIASQQPPTPRGQAGKHPIEACLSEASSAGRMFSRLPSPHFLSMTATPIPRTLALTLYGDLDISVLDELPPGRAKVTTKIVEPRERKHAYEKIREELAKGRQAYVICPRIEEPDPTKENALLAKSAKAEAKRLASEVFPEFSVGLLHGAMKPAEKDEVMVRFAKNEIRILVATSVVEVGINVPNATVILIEGAERFGLAQLHQLRGRIMRSSHPPFCFLFPEGKGEASRKRLRALATSDDGFKLAEADLAARGAGDLFGRKQWGISDLGMDALKNVKLIRAAREEAQRIIAADPELGGLPALAARAAGVSAEMHSE